MSAPWSFSDPPGDPVADIRRCMRMLDELPKPKSDRFKVASLDALKEHLQESPARSWPTLDLGPSIIGMPVFVDETVEPGWIEAWLGDECVDRVRIA